jgi:hypothetical protein
MTEPSHDLLMVQCPSCSKKSPWQNNENRPFCSERCKNHDFVNWANEEHKIAGSPSYDDILSGDLEQH